MTYTDGGVLVQLVFGCDAKACAVAASGPGQVDCCLQFVAHLLVDGASKLGPIIASETGKGEMSCDKEQNKLLHFFPSKNKAQTKVSPKMFEAGQNSSTAGLFVAMVFNQSVRE